MSQNFNHLKQSALCLPALCLLALCSSPLSMALASSIPPAEVLYDSNPENSSAQDLAYSQAEDICTVNLKVFEDKYFEVDCDFTSHWIQVVYPFFVEKTYRVRVLGVGKLSELPWKTLVNSLSLGDSLGQSLPALTYDTTEEAWLNCSEVLMARQYESEDGWKFNRAKCFTFEQKNTNGSQFYFEIQTQNPLGLA